jgi:beta-phosphoglucomutase
MPAIRALIFDLDGVITDTAEYHYLAWKQLADEEAIPFTRADNEMLRGVSRRESLLRLLKGRSVPEETMQNWMDRKNRYYLRYLEQITPADCLPGVREVLQQARASGLKLGIGSASRNARDVLGRLGILDWFDVIGDGYSVVHTKPAPDLFVWVAGGLGIPVDQAVVFEDASAGVDAAIAAGCYTVGIGHAGVTHADIVLPGLDGVSVSDLLTRLQALRS